MFHLIENKGYQLGTFGHLCLVDFFVVVTMLLGNKSYTVGKPEASPFKGQVRYFEH